MRGGDKDRESKEREREERKEEKGEVIHLSEVVNGKKVRIRMERNVKENYAIGYARRWEKERKGRKRNCQTL